MTTIKVDVADHLATKIDAMRDRLPDLLCKTLMLSVSDNGTIGVLEIALLRMRKS